MFIVYPVINLPPKHVRAKSLYSGVRQYLRRQCIAMQLGYIVADSDKDEIIRRLDGFRADWKRITGSEDGFSIIVVDARCDTEETFYCIQEQVLKHCADYIRQIAKQYEKRIESHEDTSWVLDKRTLVATTLPYEFVLKFSDMFPALYPAVEQLHSADILLGAPSTVCEGVRMLYDTANTLYKG